MTDLLAVKSLLLGHWLALLFVLERLMPAAAWPPGQGPFARRRLLANGILWGIALATSALVVVPVTAWATARAPLWELPKWLGPNRLAVDLIILDCWLYWWHRANHEVPFLWRWHEIHHLDTMLDSTTALRFHGGELVLSALVRAVVIIAFAMPLASIVVFETAVLAAALFHHANLRLPPRFERAVSLLLVTPSIHWVHHHAVRRDTDSNYATILSVWDRIFGTRSPTKRWDGMPLGVENGITPPTSELIVRPFRPRR